MAHYDLIGERYLVYGNTVRSWYDGYVTYRCWGSVDTTEYDDRIDYTITGYVTIAKSKSVNFNARIRGSVYATIGDGNYIEPAFNQAPQTSSGDAYLVINKSGSVSKAHSAFDITSVLNFRYVQVYFPDISETVSSTASSSSAVVNIPVKTSYTISYNNNGGNSTPASQTKWYGENLQLQNSISRTGYTFAGWNTNSSGTGTNYSALGTYSANAGATLYAKWTANTYTVKYNANPPSGKTATGSTPSSSHTYNTANTLTSNGFAVADYLFQGWATSSSGGVVYTNGQSVINLSATQGATVNLYAVWKFQYTNPNIEDINSYRVTESNGSYTHDDFGTNARIDVLVTPAVKELANGTTEYISTRLQAYYKLHTASSWTTVSNPPSTTTRQTVSQYITATLGIDNQYDVKVVAQGIDGGQVKCESTITDYITSAKFILDFNGDYDSVGFFASAPDLTDVVKVEGDTHTNNLLIYVDSSAGSGTDSELKTALENLGWWSAVNVTV